MDANYLEKARKIPQEDLPISKKKLSGLSNFFGLYGGEHIAATEFVIGATLVTWGCKATDIIIGLIIGNILATLTYALICAPIAVDTRLTLYSYLKKVMGPYVQKIYNFVWGLASIAMAASMLTVSASAVREIFGVAPQTNWYPTDIRFILIVLVLGTIVTIVAANGFEAVAKFSGICVPWMIVVFFSGAMVCIPMLIDATGFGQISGISDFLKLANSHIWNGVPVEGGQQLGIIHVIGFAWMCNLAYHGGLNDMSLFRYAKSAKYGFVTAYGMFIGHFFAWCSAGIMGATAAILLNTSLSVLDSGAITNAVLGGMGLFAVIVAGWTTANPSIYRASLAFETIFNKLGIKKLSYLVGVVMTIMACFPITSNIMVIVNIIVLVVPTIGAICIAEHWVLPKIGGTRYWATFKGWKTNYAALIAWAISLTFVVINTQTGWIHSYLLFLPNYLLAFIVYIVLALLMGAKDDYSKQVLEEEKLQAAINVVIDEMASDEVDNSKVVIPGLIKLMQYMSYVILVIIAILSICVLIGSFDANNFKNIAGFLTIGYFILGGGAAIYKYRVLN